MSSKEGTTSKSTLLYSDEWIYLVSCIICIKCILLYLLNLQYAFILWYCLFSCKHILKLLTWSSLRQDVSSGWFGHNCGCWWLYIKHSLSSYFVKNTTEEQHSAAKQTHAVLIKKSVSNYCKHLVSCCAWRKCFSTRHQGKVRYLANKSEVCVLLDAVLTNECGQR